MLTNFAPVTLQGSIVRLEPLSPGHVVALAEVGLDPELWRWQPAPIASVEDMHSYVATALAQQDQGVALPFVIVEKAGGRIIGSTRYLDIAVEHDRLEIGATWIASTWQRSDANTEAKFLLLRHAFENLEAKRIVFKTEALNEKSRRAILRIGAVQEGIFRRHLLARSGRARDMVYFSILAEEWPEVKAKLLAMPAAHGSAKSGEGR